MVLLLTEVYWDGKQLNIHNKTLPVNESTFPVFLVASSIHRETLWICRNVDCFIKPKFIQIVGWLCINSWVKYTKEGFQIFKKYSNYIIRKIKFKSYNNGNYVHMEQVQNVIANLLHSELWNDIMFLKAKFCGN